jgi:hypothetical protein
MKTLYFVCLALILLISGFIPAMPQRLEQIVSVHYENQSLKAVLNDLGQNFGLKFSYEPGDIPLETTVTIRFTDRSLRYLLDLLSGQTGVGYTIIDDHIALYSQEKEPENNKQAQRDSGPPADLPAAVVSLPEDSPDESIMADTMPHTLKFVQMNGISRTGQVKPESSLLLLFSLDPSKKGSEPPSEIPGRKLLSLGTVISADFYHLSGKADENKSFTYKTSVNYSVGVSVGLKVKERWHILVQVLYSTKNFDLYYNIQTKNEDDPFIPDKTVYQQSYLDIPILLDYQVLEKGDWKFFGEVGFVPGFLLNNNTQTYHHDGSEMQTEEFLAMKIRPQLFGAQLGMMAKDQISKHFSLTVATGWRHYFNGINKEDLPTKLGLFQCAAGIGYTF